MLTLLTNLSANLPVNVIDQPTETSQIIKFAAA